MHFPDKYIILHMYIKNVCIKKKTDQDCVYSNLYFPLIHDFKKTWFPTFRKYENYTVFEIWSLSGLKNED